MGFYTEKDIEIDKLRQRVEEQRKAIDGHEAELAEVSRWRDAEARSASMREEALRQRVEELEREVGNPDNWQAAALKWMDEAKAAEAKLAEAQAEPNGLRKANLGLGAALAQESLKVKEARADIESLQSAHNFMHGEVERAEAGMMKWIKKCEAAEAKVERLKRMWPADAEIRAAKAEAEVARLRDHLLKASEANGTQIRSLKAEVARLRAAIVYLIKVREIVCQHEPYEGSEQTCAKCKADAALAPEVKP